MRHSQKKSRYASSTSEEEEEEEEEMQKLQKQRQRRKPNKDKEDVSDEEVEIEKEIKKKEVQKSKGKLMESKDDEEGISDHDADKLKKSQPGVFKRCFFGIFSILWSLLNFKVIASIIIFLLVLTIISFNASGVSEEQMKDILTHLKENMVAGKSHPSVRKLDESGNFTSFAGNTIIFKLADEEIDRWKAIHHYIKTSPVLNKYFAPLPPSSYHMTLFELFHEGPMPRGAYLSLLKEAKPNFMLLQNILLKNPIVPQTATVKSISVGGIIAFLVTMSEEEVEALNSFRTIAGHTTLLGNSGSYTYHITLAYLYNTPQDKDEASLIQSDVNVLIKFLNSEIGLSKVPLRFKPARVVEYSSMEQFDELH